MEPISTPCTPHIEDAIEQHLSPAIHDQLIFACVEYVRKIRDPRLDQNSRLAHFAAFVTCFFEDFSPIKKKTDNSAPLLEAVHNALTITAVELNMYSSPEFSISPTVEFLQKILTTQCTRDGLLNPYFDEIAPLLQHLHPAFRVLYYKTLFQEAKENNQPALLIELSLLILYEIPALSDCSHESIFFSPIWNLVPVEVLAPSLNYPVPATEPLAFHASECTYLSRLISYGVLESEKIDQFLLKFFRIRMIISEQTSSLYRVSSGAKEEKIALKSELFLLGSLSGLSAVLCADPETEPLTQTSKTMAEALGKKESSASKMFLELLEEFLKPLMFNVQQDSCVGTFLRDFLFQVDLFYLSLGGELMTKNGFFRFTSHPRFNSQVQKNEIIALRTVALHRSCSEQMLRSIITKFPVAKRPIEWALLFCCFYPPTSAEEASSLLLTTYTHACLNEMVRKSELLVSLNRVNVPIVLKGLDEVDRVVASVFIMNQGSAELLAQERPAAAFCSLMSNVETISYDEFCLLLSIVNKKVKPLFPTIVRYANYLYQCLNALTSTTNNERRMKILHLYYHGDLIHLPFSGRQLKTIYLSIIHTLQTDEIPEEFKKQSTKESAIDLLFALADLIEYPIPHTSTIHDHLNSCRAKGRDPQLKKHYEKLQETAELHRQKAVVFEQEWQKASQLESNLTEQLKRVKKELLDARKEKKAQIDQLEKQLRLMEKELAKQHTQLQLQIGIAERETEQFEVEMELIRAENKRLQKRTPQVHLPELCIEELTCGFSGALPADPVIVVDPLTRSEFGLEGFTTVAERAKMSEYLQRRGASIERAAAAMTPLPFLSPLLSHLSGQKMTPKVYLHTPLAAQSILTTLDSITVRSSILADLCKQKKLPPSIRQRLNELAQSLQPDQQQKTRKLLRSQIEATLSGGVVAEKIVSDLRVVAEAVLKIILISFSQAQYHPILDQPRLGNILRDSHRIATLTHRILVELKIEKEFASALTRIDQNGWEFYRTEYMPRDTQAPKVYQMMYGLSSELAQDPSEDKVVALSIAFQEEVMPAILFLLETVDRLLEEALK